MIKELKMKITQETNCAAKTIGKSIDFSDKFVLKVLRPLTSANIVLPFRGVTGGYCLGKTTDKITLFDVIVAVQNDINILTVMKNMSKKDIKKDARISPDTVVTVPTSCLLGTRLVHLII